MKELSEYTIEELRNEVKVRAKATQPLVDFDSIDRECYLAIGYRVKCYVRHLQEDFITQPDEPMSHDVEQDYRDDIVAAAMKLVFGKDAYHKHITKLL